MKFVLWKTYKGKIINAYSRFNLPPHIYDKEKRVMKVLGFNNWTVEVDNLNKNNATFLDEDVAKTFNAVWTLPLITQNSQLTVNSRTLFPLRYGMIKYKNTAVTTILTLQHLRFIQKRCITLITWSKVIKEAQRRKKRVEALITLKNNIQLIEGTALWLDGNYIPHLNTLIPHLFFTRFLTPQQRVHFLMSMQTTRKEVSENNTFYTFPYTTRGQPIKTLFLDFESLLNTKRQQLLIKQLRRMKLNTVTEGVKKGMFKDERSAWTMLTALLPPLTTRELKALTVMKNVLELLKQNGWIVIIVSALPTWWITRYVRGWAHAVFGGEVFDALKWNMTYLRDLLFYTGDWGITKALLTPVFKTNSTLFTFYPLTPNQTREYALQLLSVP